MENESPTVDIARSAPKGGEPRARTLPKSAQAAKPRSAPWKASALIFVGVIIGFFLGTIGVSVYHKLTRPAPSNNLLTMPDSAVSLRPGPWGNLEALETFIEPPEEYLSTSLIEQADRSWKFTGYTQDQLVQLFQTADLTAEQKKELLDTSRWKQDKTAIYVLPSQDLVLALSPQARKQIYQPMLGEKDTLIHFSELTYPADRFDVYFANSGLGADTLALIRKLCFPHGDMLVFCDTQAVLATMSTPEQKKQLLKALARKPTLFLRLHITPNSDMTELENYWSRAGWGLDVRPMLESLATLPKGARVSLAYLLPPVPSAQLYTYPYPSSDPMDLNKDCHWTALNFFRDKPDDRFTDSNFVAQTLKNDYYPADSDPRYGDLIELSRPDGEIIHSAVYIAADIVFTKNSGNFHDPYILMTLSDMVDHFSTQIPEGQKLGVTALRNKYY